MYNLISVSSEHKNQTDQDIIKKSTEDGDTWYQYFNSAIKTAAIMRSFLYIDGAQWTPGEAADRQMRGKVTYQNNMTAAIIRKLISEERAAAPQGMVIPIDANVPTKVVKIKTNLMEQIAYESRSDMVFANTYADMLECGFGGCELRAVPESTTSFNKVLRIEKPDDVLYMYWDSNAKHENKIDGDFAGSYYCIGKQEAEHMYDTTDIQSVSLPPYVGPNYKAKMRKDTIILRRHYMKCYGKITMVKLSDGAEMSKKIYQSVIKEMRGQYEKNLEKYNQMVADVAAEAQKRGLSEQIAEFAISRIPEPQEPDIPTIKKTKRCMAFYIELLVLSKDKILERERLPLEFIPQFYVGGDDKQASGMQIPQPYAANAMMPQRQINLICSEQFDNIGRSYGLRAVAHEDAVKGKEPEYQRASISNLLTFKTVDGAGENSQTSAPRFQYISGVDPNLMQIYQQAQQDLKTVLGRYNENLGDESNAYGYEAILNRQLNGDIASGIFPDNLNKMIAECYKLAMDWMPFIYDTERSVLIRNKEGQTEFVTINRATGEQDDSGNLVLENDMRLGKFTVEVYGGVSFAAQRLAGMQFLAKNFEQDPDLKHDLFDLYLDMAPFPFTNEAKRRLRETGYINPVVVAAEENKPPPKPKPNPVQELAKIKMVSEIESMKSKQASDKLNMLKTVLDFKKAIAGMQIDADKEKFKAEKAAEEAKADAMKEGIQVFGDTIESFADVAKADAEFQSQNIDKAMDLMQSIIDKEMKGLESINAKTSLT
jgi:hypothetical protein